MHQGPSAAFLGRQAKCMSSSTIYEPLARSRYFKDHEGVLSTSKAEDDELRVIWDLTDFLASGETVSSVAYEDSGATTSSKSVATPQILFTVTGIGETTVTATLSTSRTVERTFRFYDTRGNRAATDYQL